MLFFLQGIHSRNSTTAQTVKVLWMEQMLPRLLLCASMNSAQNTWIGLRSLQIKTWSRHKVPISASQI